MKLFITVAALLVASAAADHGAHPHPHPVHALPSHHAPAPYHPEPVYRAEPAYHPAPAPYHPAPAPYHPAPHHAPAPYHDEPQYDTPYTYGYEVNDYDAYGKPNVHSKHEERDGKTVKGQYKILLPDCRTQIVDYYVDEYKAYHADVKYEGEICEYVPPVKGYAPHPAPHKAAPYHPAPHAAAPAPYHPAPAPYQPAPYQPAPYQPAPYQPAPAYHN